MNNQRFDIDPLKSARVYLKAARRMQILVSAEGRALGTTVLLLRTNLMREDERHLLFPDRDLYRKIKALEPDAFYQARATLGHSADESTSRAVQQALVNVASAVTYDETQGTTPG